MSVDESALKIHHEARRLAADENIPYALAYDRVFAKARLDAAGSTLEPHFEALLRCRVAGFKPSARGFSQRYALELVAINRRSHNARAAAPATVQSEAVATQLSPHPTAAKVVSISADRQSAPTRRAMSPAEIDREKALAGCLAIAEGRMDASAIANLRIGVHGPSALVGEVQRAALLKDPATVRRISDRIRSVAPYGDPKEAA